MIDNGLISLYNIDMTICVYKQKIGSTFLVTKKMQMEMRYHFSAYRLTSVKKFFLQHRVGNRWKKKILFLCTVGER